METKYFEILTFNASKLWPWANMLPNMNKCGNCSLNFSASFRVLALKLTELIRSELPNQKFSSIFYVPLFADDVIMSQRFLCLSLHLRLLSLYTLYETTEVSTKTRFTNLKIHILWATRETIPRTWSSETMSQLGCLISFQLPMGFQNFVVINKIHSLKKTARYTNRLQFEKETTVTHSIKDSTKVELNNKVVHPCI